MAANTMQSIGPVLEMHASEDEPPHHATSASGLPRRLPQALPGHGRRGKHGGPSVYIAGPSGHTIPHPTLNQLFSESKMARVCTLTGKRPNVANKVSHSNIKTKKRQFPNLQTKRIWYAEESRWVKLRVSTRALRTLRHMSLGEFARKNGLNISKL